jgi:hypothetical protein
MINHPGVSPGVVVGLQCVAARPFLWRPSKTPLRKKASLAPALMRRDCAKLFHALGSCDIGMACMGSAQPAVSTLLFIIARIHRRFVRVTKARLT